MPLSREERQLREGALARAVEWGGESRTADQISDAAEKFYQFLKGSLSPQSGRLS